MDESADVCSADLAVGAAVDAVGLGGQREGTAGRIDLKWSPGLDEALGDGGAAGRLLGDEPARDPQEAGPPEGEGAGLGANRVEQLGTDHQEVVEGVGRQHLGLTLQELLKSSMNKEAALGGTGMGIETVERAHMENHAGTKGMGS